MSIYKSFQAVKAGLTGNFVPAINFPSQLTTLLENNKVLCLPNLMAHSFVRTRIAGGNDTAITTVDVNFQFIHTETDEEIACRATGIYNCDSLVLTNTCIDQAKHAALLSVFGIVPDRSVEQRKELATTAAAEAGHSVKTADELPEKAPETPATATPPLSVPASPQTFTRQQQAENLKTLIAWREQIGGLSIEQPAAWTIHLAKMKGFGFLSNDAKRIEFEAMRNKGNEYGVGYDEGKKAFFLLPLAGDNDVFDEELAQMTQPA